MEAAEATSARKILVVDDEQDIVRSIQLGLEQVGYQVHTARDGHEALSAVATERPDLIILDVRMPVMDGLQVLDCLKGDAKTHDIPIVMLTAAADQQDMKKGWEHGSDLYLTKPIHPVQLADYMQTLLSR
ncbi:MAG: response regulator [Abitibacteriaceae bacterium]|nr:response regulator [Abditibacteriaceae bacterium]MBV9863818.1 response regulator [Abditibacteriaceae bacterium]